MLLYIFFNLTEEQINLSEINLIITLQNKNTIFKINTIGET